MSLLADIGLALSGASALGGALGLFGGESGHKRLSQMQGYQNLELQRKAFEQPIQTRVADALKAGVHPLFALGYSGSTAMPSVDFQPDGDSGRMRDLGVVGDVLQRAGARREEKKLSKKQAELIDAEILAKQAEARHSDAMATAATSAAVLASQPGLGPGMQAEPPRRTGREHLSGGDWPNEGPMGAADDLDEAIWNVIRGLYRDKYVKPAEGRKLRKMYVDKKRKAPAKGFRWDSGPCKGLTAKQCEERRR